MESVRAWRPAVPGVAEVFHARFVSHAYPVHTHDTWTLLIVTPSRWARGSAAPHDLARRPTVAKGEL